MVALRKGMKVHALQVRSQTLEKYDSADRQWCQHFLENKNRQWRSEHSQWNMSLYWLSVEKI